jgi:hypothetical protein
MFALAMALSLLLRSENRSHDKIFGREPVLMLKNWVMLLLSNIPLKSKIYTYVCTRQGEKM